MKKTVTLLLIIASLLTFLTMPAFAEGEESENKPSLFDSIPDFDVSAQLYDLLKKADIDELSVKIKDYLAQVKNMSDEEICSSLHDFCTKYAIEVTDGQLEAFAKFAKKAVDYDVDDIKAEINNLREKAGIVVKIVVFLRNVIDAVAEFFSGIANLFSDKSEA